MGVVYRGERVQLGRPVAVKFLHPWIAAQKAFLTRFENEAQRDEPPAAPALRLASSTSASRARPTW